MRVDEAGLYVYATVARPLPRRIKKAKASSALTERAAPADMQPMVSAAARAGGDPSHSETIGSDESPASGASCGFMAQLIGQILTARRSDAQRATKAYDAARALAETKDFENAL